MKKCNICKKYKPLNCFELYKKVNNKFCYRWECKACRNKYVNNISIIRKYVEQDKKFISLNMCYRMYDIHRWQIIKWLRWGYISASEYKRHQADMSSITFRYIDKKAIERNFYNRRCIIENAKFKIWDKILKKKYAKLRNKYYRHRLKLWKIYQSKHIKLIGEKKYKIMLDFLFKKVNI